MRWVLIASLTSLGLLPASAQRLHTQDVVLNEPMTIAIPPLGGPSFVVVHGRVQKDDPKAIAADARLVLDGQDLGPLSDYAITPGVYRAHLPLDVTGQGAAVARVLKVVPDPLGLVLRSVEVVPAGVLDVEVLDEETRTPVPAFIELISADGSDLPHFGEPPTSLRHHAVWPVPEGKGRVLFPPGPSLRFLAWSHPFRCPAREAVRLGTMEPARARFLLGPDVRPVGSHLLGLPFPSDWPADLRASADRILGVARRPPLKPRQAANAQSVLGVPEFLEARLLDGDLPPPRFLHGSGKGLLPLGPRSLATLELPDGRLLHSNGPILSVRGIYRDRVLDRVVGELGCRFSLDVEPERLRILTEQGEILSLQVEKPQDMPLDLRVPPSTRVLIVFEGRRFRVDPIAGPRPYAAMVLVVP
jgi:hypothetical protein